MGHKKSQFTKEQVVTIASLANVSVSSELVPKLAQSFRETLEVIDRLKDIDTSSVEPTHQITGLMNVWREDEVDSDTMFTQKQALAAAPHSHNGYFLVPRITSQDGE